MKVIELLTKIANGEEVPKKIRYHLENYHYEDCLYLNGIREENRTFRNAFNYYYIERCLNDEVEIIEEDKKIEKLENKIDTTFENYNYSERMRLTEMVNKINELIDKINKEK